MNSLTVVCVLAVLVAGIQSQVVDPSCRHYARCLHRTLSICPLPCCPGKRCCPNSNCQMYCEKVTPVHLFNGNSMTIPCPRTTPGALVDCRSRSMAERCTTGRHSQCDAFGRDAFCCPDHECGAPGEGYCYNINSIGSPAAFIDGVSSFMDPIGMPAPGYVDPVPKY